MPLDSFEFEPDYSGLEQRIIASPRFDPELMRRTLGDMVDAEGHRVGASPYCPVPAEWGDRVQHRTLRLEYTVGNPSSDYVELSALLRPISWGAPGDLSLKNERNEAEE